MSGLIEALKGLQVDLDRSNQLAVGKHAKKLREIIAEHERSGGWMPIDTAPIDGTRILLIANGLIEVGHRMRSSGLWRDQYGEKLSNVTHWQPLPKGPQS